MNRAPPERPDTEFQRMFVHKFENEIQFTLQAAAEAPCGPADFGAADAVFCGLDSLDFADARKVTGCYKFMKARCWKIFESTTLLLQYKEQIMLLNHY